MTLQGNTEDSTFSMGIHSNVSHTIMKIATKILLLLAQYHEKAPRVHYLQVLQRCTRSQEDLVSVKKYLMSPFPSILISTSACVVDTSGFWGRLIPLVQKFVPDDRSINQD